MRDQGEKITNIALRAAQPEDADLLAPVAAETFRDGWATIITPEIADAYIAESLSAAQFACEIADPSHYIVLAVETDGQIAGYAKLVTGKQSPSFVRGETPIQLQRLYVRAEQRGAGIADALLGACTREALRRGADTLFLETDPRNDRAWRFYEKRGFRDVGGTVYALPGGAVNDQVRVMQKRLRPDLRIAAPNDAEALGVTAAAVFSDTFAADSDPVEMAAYLAVAFHADTLRAELENPFNLFLLATDEESIVGYAKLSFASDEHPECLYGNPPFVELERFYVCRPWQGTGVADALMEATLQAAATAKDAETVWLGVYADNGRARRFYARWGFVDVGEHIFMLGTAPETDRVMARPLSA